MRLSGWPRNTTALLALGLWVFRPEDLPSKGSLLPQVPFICPDQRREAKPVNPSGSAKSWAHRHRVCFTLGRPQAAFPPCLGRRCCRCSFTGCFSLPVLFRPDLSRIQVGYLSAYCARKRSQPLPRAHLRAAYSTSSQRSPPGAWGRARAVEVDHVSSWLDVSGSDGQPLGAGRGLRSLPHMYVGDPP